MKIERKLAAIIFADIAGYTTMMHKNEEKATKVLKRYNTQLTEKVTTYNGEIVKRYGDGTLILFPSAIDAVTCSIDLQTAFKESPQVPLRIGIHLGEVTHRDNDYFGNDINVCARIESMGIPGCILISREVQNKTKNQPTIETTSLGNYHFKNLPEPLEVFAISNEGIVIPDKHKVKGKFEKPKSFFERYNKPLLLLVPILLLLAALFYQYLPLSNQQEEENFLLNKKVAILPFENETNDTTLQVVGKMVTDWVTQTMIVNKAGKLVEVSSIDEAKIKTEEGFADFLEKTKTQIFIKGRYFLDGENITLTTSIVDANQNILHAIPPLSGKKINPINILTNLQEELLSYWFLGEEWLGNHPPKYSAYKLFLSLENTWGNDNGTSEQNLIKALEIDSTFYRCHIALAQLYLNSYQNEKSDSIIQFLERGDYPLSEYELLRLKTTKAQLFNDWKTAAERSEEIYHKFNEKLRGLDAIDFYNRINHPKKALKILNNTKELSELGDCYQCQSGFRDLVSAYYRLGEYQKVIELVSPVAEQIIDADIAVIHLRALVKLYKMEQVEVALEQYKNLKLEWFGRYNQNLLYWAICQELYLDDKTSTLEIYAKKMLDFASLYPDFGLYEQDMFMSNFFLKNHKMALSFATKLTDKHGSYYDPQLTIMKIVNGNRQAGEDFLSKEKGTDNKYESGEWEYNRGLIQAALGNKAEAIKSLVLAEKKGMPFLWYTFQNEVFFKSLLKEDAFKELVKIKK